MVAIGIIAILLAIAIPALSGILRAKKGDATKATMKTLETAIELYSDDDPFSGTSGTTVVCDNSPDDTTLGNLFGDLPPTPRTVLSRVPTKCNGIPGDAPIMAQNFANILGALGMTGSVQTGAVDSTEALLFFLRRYSTQSRDVIDKLPDAVRKNADAQTESFTIGGSPLALEEIVDAWNQPLIYAVQSSLDPDTGEYDGRRHRWELRSAGEDGNYNLPFSDVPNSDDVVLRSEWKDRN